MRQEFMEWRIQQTNRCWTTIQSLENPLKIPPLERKKLFKSFSTVHFVVRKNHLTHRVNTISFEKHMFGSTQTNSRSTEGNRIRNLRRRIRIGPDRHLGGFLAPTHKFGEVFEVLAFLGIQFLFYQNLNNLRWSSLQLASENFAGSSIDRHVITFFEGLAINFYSARMIVDFQIGSSAYADLPHLTGNQSRVGGNATPCG